MGNPRNRSRKKRKIPPPGKRVVNQHGESSQPTYKDPGPSAKKIGKNTEKLRDMSEIIDSTVKEGTIFMDLYYSMYSMF